MKWHRAWALLIPKALWVVWELLVGWACLACPKEMVHAVYSSIELHLLLVSAVAVVRGMHEIRQPHFGAPIVTFSVTIATLEIWAVSLARAAKTIKKVSCSDV